MSVLLLSLLLLFSSCSFEHWIDVRVVIPEAHPIEEAYSEDFWFTLSYFDGERIRECHIPSGVRSISIKVRSGSLAVFSFRPLGELGAIGGFFEPGDDTAVNVIPEYGSFSELLLRAASYRAEPVARLSMRKLIDGIDDLQAVDEISFLRDVFNGTLEYGITLNDKSALWFDSIPSGEWISERFDIPSFSVISTGDKVNFNLYPGVYRYAEKEKGMLLTIIVEESGEGCMMITAMPVW